MTKLKKILMICLTVSLISGCTTGVQIRSDSIKAHWIKRGEKAPYNGILLNDYTYYRLVDKAMKCDK